MIEVTQGKDLITTETWTTDELERIILLAKAMKRDPFSEKWCHLLKNKKFLMLFYNPSLRTHLSFESAVSDLGGYPIFRSHQLGWVSQKKEKGAVTSSESIKDTASVISRYVDGIGIRITMDAVSRYGEGNAILETYAKYADIPVISMADDRFHPCQGLSDLMAWCEGQSQKKDDFHLDSLHGKTLLLTWGSSGFARPWASVQSHLLLAARFGMNVRLAHPQGYNLEPEVIERARDYCRINGRAFQIIHDPDSGYKNADVVYVRNWVSQDAYADNQFNYAEEIQKSLAMSDWIVTEKRMNNTNRALFSNPMPLDRGREAEDRVADSPQSLLYDVAENRRHIQKAILALTMTNASLFSTSRLSMERRLRLAKSMLSIV